MICMIYQKCLSTGTFPTNWKLANLQSVHKKNSRQIKTNYRPISLLCICSKIFEKLIYDDMFNFFISNNLITQHQSGFMPGDSTINQLLSITTEIYNAFENYEETRALFLDLSKAFDKVYTKVKYSNLNKTVFKTTFWTYLTTCLEGSKGLF